MLFFTGASWCRAQQSTYAMGTEELDSLLLAEEAQEPSPGLFGSPLGAGASSSGGSSPSHAAAGEQAAAKPKDKDKKASKGKVRV